MLLDMNMCAPITMLFFCGHVGPIVQRVGLCWGTEGTNVTQFKR